MDQLTTFFASDNVLAFLIAFLIFLMTTFLVVKKWIGFAITLLFLLFSLAAGMVIKNQQSVHDYFHFYALTSQQNQTHDAFQKQITQAVENIRVELNTEKENVRLMMHQVNEIVDSIDVQKQKLQHFIDETRERFKTEQTPKESNPKEPAAAV